MANGVQLIILKAAFVWIIIAIMEVSGYQSTLYCFKQIWRCMPEKNHHCFFPLNLSKNNVWHSKMCTKLMLSFMSKSSVHVGVDLYTLACRLMWQGVRGKRRHGSVTPPHFHVSTCGGCVCARPCSCITATTMEQYILYLVHPLTVCLYNHASWWSHKSFVWLVDLGWISVLFP